MLMKEPIAGRKDRYAEGTKENRALRTGCCQCQSRWEARAEHRGRGKYSPETSPRHSTEKPLQKVLKTRQAHKKLRPPLRKWVSWWLSEAKTFWCSNWRLTFGTGTSSRSGDVIHAGTC
ncbi:hypothetical protein NL676_009111 [Syzygium grande]|nr:hypothetical protein NL676_009111 [Syzygium grande]